MNFFISLELNLHAQIYSQVFYGLHKLRGQDGYVLGRTLEGKSGKEERVGIFCV